MMEPDHAIEIVQKLADRVDPYSGERFPSGSPYQQADTLRTLHLALEGLTKLRRSTARKTGPGCGWTEEELLRQIDDKIDVEEIAKQHERTTGAICARLETDRETTSTLLDASQAVWFSHGYTNRVDGYYGLSELYGRLDSSLDLPSSAILENGNRVALGFRLLNTEQLRAVAYQGLAEFLSRGGKIDDISLSNISTFYSVIPLNECMQYDFPPLAKKFLTPADVLVAAGRFPRTESGRVWMKSVFR